MLRPALMKRYLKLFDEAEAAVGSDAVLLERVKRARMPLLYSELELLRTETEKDLATVTQKLNYFEQEAKRMGDPMLNERNNHALEYCKLYRERNLTKENVKLAKGAKVIWIQRTLARIEKLG